MMFAGGVSLPPDLTQALSGIGAGGTAGINDIYAKQKQRMATEAITKVPGNVNSYGPQRMGVQQSLDQGNLEAALGGTLGNTSYNNALQQREYTQNENLARLAASYNKPDLLQEVLQGIGGVGKTAATYYGLKGMGSGGSSPSSPSFGLSDPYQYGLGNPDIPDFGYGQTYPSMMRRGGF